MALAETEALRFVAEVTGAGSARRAERIQTLWSGYGELFRVELEGADVPTVIVKWVKPPARRGDRSHARKLRSYDVETTWYRTFASRCDTTCRVPTLLGSRTGKDEWLLVLEDLDGAGFSGRGGRGAGGLEACLGWLAGFHARFLGVAPAGLWKTGTYWHLATRPDELANMDDAALREAAPLLDRMLGAAAFQTLVHGDAKLPNFCFAREASSTATVAAVDFQYVGGGCGMRDVAYLISGAPGEGRLLDEYFRCLRDRLEPSVDAGALESEWRALYPIACADFYRFLAGWAKESWRRDAHAQRVTREVLSQLARA